MNETVNGFNNAGNTPEAAASDQQARISQTDKDMLFRLKGSMDMTGRYSYRLTDMAVGYSAGTGLPLADARLQIEKKFEREFGQSPKEYLQQLYDQRKERDRSQTLHV